MKCREPKGGGILHKAGQHFAKPRLGAFGRLLQQYPVIRDQLESAFFNKEDSRLSLGGHRISKRDYFDFFLILCRECGIG